MGGRVPVDDLPGAPSAVPADDLPGAPNSAPAPKAGTLKNIGMGAVKGASDIGATILRPVDALLNATGITDLTNEERRQKLGQFFGENADTDSWAFKGGELASGIAGTAGAGGVLAKGVMGASRLVPAIAQIAPKLAAALESGGLRLTGAPATTIGQQATNAAIRTGAGAVTGGAQAAMINPDEAGTGAAIGAVLPGGVKAAGVVGNALASRAKNKILEAAAAASRNSVRDATLKAGQDAGLVTPPSVVNPSWLNKRMESIAGKDAMKADVSARNVEGIDALARKAAGLTPDQPLSESVLSTARRQAAQPYRDVAALNKTAAQALEDLNAARLESKLQWNAHNRNGDVAAYKAAQVADAEAGRLEKVIDAEAQKANNPDLLKSLRAARVQIAKIHNVEKATNVGNASVDASVLGRALDRGAPLTGELETIAKFQQSFPNYAREQARSQAAGVSKSEAILGTLLGTGGAMAAGPVGMAAGAIPLLSGPVRNLILSKAYQSAMAKPNYSAGKINEAVAKLASTPGASRLAKAALRAIPAADATLARP